MRIVDRIIWLPLLFGGLLWSGSLLGETEGFWNDPVFQKQVDIFGERESDSGDTSNDPQEQNYDSTDPWEQNNNATQDQRSATPTPRRRVNPATSYASYTGAKTTIAILGFENKTKGIYGSNELGEGLSEMLSSELLRTNRFILIEREALGAILKEQELGQTGLMRRGSSPKTGGLAGAKLLIKGVVSEFQYKAGGKNMGLAFKGLDFGSKSSTAHVGIDIRVIDATSGQVIASERASAEAESSGFNVGFSKAGAPWKINGGNFERTPLGVATRDAIRQAVHFIIEQSKGIEWTASVVKASGEQVYINRGSTSNIRTGDRFVIYSKGESLIDPETGLNLGSDEEFSGSLIITVVKQKYSIGR
ncbi:MAG: CsgG/HfaB family protein [Candidatus Sedimenticola sp. (ex Thyasira tokunagai)]